MTTIRDSLAELLAGDPGAQDLQGTLLVDQLDQNRLGLPPHLARSLASITTTPAILAPATRPCLLATSPIGKPKGFGQ